MSSFNFDHHRSQVEQQERWRELREEIPAFTPSPETTIQVIPPSAGATARFIIARKDRPDKNVSVYLDHFDRLGYMGYPYYEAYPIDGDTARFPMTQEGMDEMMNEIHKELQVAQP